MDNAQFINVMKGQWLKTFNTYIYLSITLNIEVYQ